MTSANQAAGAANQSRQIIYKHLLAKNYTLNVPEVPEPPEDLTEEACLWWHYYNSILVEGNCLKRTYFTSLHNICLAHVVRSELLRGIELSGGALIKDTKIGSDGIPYDIYRPNPMIDKFMACLRDMDRLLASMGMTAYTDRMLQYDSGPTGKTASRYADGPPIPNIPPPTDASLTKVNGQTPPPPHE